VVGWRKPPPGTHTPSPVADEVVTFAAFHERGLGLPAHRLLRGLPHHYKIKLHHLNPNRILHVPAFVTLCEAYLGIEPDS
jgi:hypothetical protein